MQIGQIIYLTNKGSIYFSDKREILIDFSNIMRYKILIASIFVLIYCNSYAQINNEVIFWESKLKLKSLDFQGVVDTLEGYLISPTAVTTSIIRKVLIKKEWGYSYRTIHYFSRKLSWKKDTISELLLRHEQGHFDISEIYARKMRKVIDELENNKVKERKQYSNAIKKYNNEMKHTHKLYDKETYYGASGEYQEKWDNWISNELLKLKNYEVDYKSLCRELNVILE